MKYSSDAGERMDIFADNFGVAPGLEVVMRHLNDGLVMVMARHKGEAFESYRAVPVEKALEVAGYLIRGSQPPRALFCPCTPAR